MEERKSRTKNKGKITSTQYVKGEILMRGNYRGVKKSKGEDARGNRSTKKGPLGLKVKGEEVQVGTSHGGEGGGGRSRHLLSRRGKGRGGER